MKPSLLKPSLLKPSLLKPSLLKPGLPGLACAGLLAAVLPSLALAQTLSLGGSAPPEAEAEAAAADVDPATVEGLPSARDYRPPDGIGFKTADVFSDNVRLTAQWFWAANPDGRNEGRTLPTVIIAAGWGATAAGLRPDAIALARAGYLVMLFDYRGWGDSDGRVMLTNQKPAAGGTFAGEVRELRGYIDPWEQAQDWLSAISYAATDPKVDPGRIGVMGSDLSGGYVIYAAAHDPRVKALVSQVTRADTRPSKPYQLDPAKVIAEAQAAASRLATGGPYPADRARTPGAPDASLVGAPVGAKLVRWAPVEDADDVTAPALFVLAEKEELFSNKANGQLACERVQGPRKMVILPKITHYGVYGAEHTRAINAAIDWFDRYLKPPGAPTRVPLNPKDPERGACNPPPLPPAGEEKKEGSGEGHKAPPTSGRFN
jgi:hypothetical protein